MLDGWIARKWNLKTVVGTVIDPMADKTLMTILTVCLAIKGALPGQLPLLFSSILFKPPKESSSESSLYSLGRCRYPRP